MIDYQTFAKELVNMRSLIKRMKAIRFFEEDHGKEKLKELIFFVPGYSIPALIIDRLEFDQELWDSLFVKDFHGFPEGHANHPQIKIFESTKIFLNYPMYYGNLLERVKIKEYLRLSKKRVLESNLPAELKIDAMTEFNRRNNELSNALSFVMEAT